MVSRHALRYSEPERTVDIPIETGAQPWGVYLSRVRFWSNPNDLAFSAEDEAEVGRRIIDALSFLGARADLE